MKRYMAMDEITNNKPEQLVLRTEGLVKQYGKRTVVSLSLIHI